jgi:hypothetical protein
MKSVKKQNSDKCLDKNCFASEEELVKKFVLDGIIGINMRQRIMEMPEGKRKKFLQFLSDPESADVPDSEEIEEKRRELEILDRQITVKKKSITFMNYSRETMKHLIKSEDTIRELARGGVDAAYLPELMEWIGVLRRIQDVFRDAMATIQVQGVFVENQEGSCIDA